MINPKLALIPSGYKSGKVYSILPNDATGDFDFDRASEGTRVRKDGLIEEVTDNVPRLDWLNSNCPSLLLEPERTNYAIRNTSLHLNSTLTNSGTITKTGNYAIAPDGTLTATRLQASATGSGYALLNVNGVNPSNDGDGGGYYISTIYVKSNTGQEQTCAFYGASSGSPKTRTVTTEWTRIQFKGYRPSNSKYAYVGVALSNGSDDELDFLVWGGQTELVDSYASSLIITPSTSTVTRLKDFISGGGNADLFNSLEGTFFVEMASFLNAQTNSNGIELTDSSGQNRVTIQYDTTNNQIRAEIKLANVTQALLFTTSYDVTNFNKIAVTYKYNEAKLYINGSLISTDTSVNIFAEDTLTEVRSTIAGISGGAFNLQAKIKDLRVYDRVLTEAEAIELTT